MRPFFATRLHVFQNMDELTIGVVGVGLIGGSIALGAQKAGFSVVAYDRHDTPAESNLGAVIRWVDTIKDVASASDLIFVATPISTTLAAAEALLSHLKPHTIVSEVASTKSSIAPELARMLSSRCRYIPSHPMAGSERSGWQSANRELFEGAVTVVCDDFCEDPGAITVVRSFWERLGSTTLVLDVATHDRLVAAVSHLPHLLAALLVADVSDSAEQALQVAGRGFRDLTRIASGDPSLWTEILLANRAELLNHLLRFRGQIDEGIQLLQRNDAKNLQALLNAAKRNRDKLSG
jgi:prephenate dehydrogenase